MRPRKRSPWTLAAAAALLVLCAAPLVTGDDGDLPSARIEIDTRWTAAASPHVLEEDTLLVEGATLTVEPGATVQLAAGVSLVVAGELIARGTEDARVRFVGVPDGDDAAAWGSVLFLDTAVDARFVAIDDYASGSILERCDFVGGSRALRLQAASPYVHDCTFEGNVYTAQIDDEAGGAAILVETDSAPRIVGNRFVDNEVLGRGQGGAIAAEFASPILQDNLFLRNNSSYGGAVMTSTVRSPIVGNRFESNGKSLEGGAISLFASSPAFLNNEVVGNTAFFKDGGVHVCVECLPHASPFVLDNTITDNTCDVLGAGGFGAAYLRWFAFNNVYGNTTAGAPSDFAWFNGKFGVYPDAVVHTTIAHNWWGTTDPAAIAATVADGLDDETLGVAAWEPALDAPVEAPIPRVTITTGKLGWEKDGDPMGVYLTVYNPGEARDFELVVLLSYPGLPEIPYRGPLNFEGAERTETGYRLTMPDNAVFFSRLLAPPYPAGTTYTHGYWHAALFDAATGERVGELCSIRFDFDLEASL